MFREMRRFKQQLAMAECENILARGTSGVLALNGDGGYPYAVPMSYVYDNGKIIFHSAREGHKYDAVLKSDRASFCVIDEDNVVPEKYTTYFRSVIAFGKIRILEDDV
ncbi:MAG: 5-nitroimidazole antibiotic resistance protein, partial [Clostridiales bacterium]|nr:5-nitroimidazole antibiotic resistance protein [Clostridiales bacterium]